MRKVYQTKGNSVGLPFAIAASAGITAIVFCIIPFSHLVNRPDRTLELRSTSAVDIPPPVEEQQKAPPPEPEQQKDTPPEPQLADTPQQIPIRPNLDVAIGGGGALEGFGEIRALTTVQTIQDEAFDVSEMEKKPEAVSQVAPTYPAELAKAKTEGSVTLVFILNEDGRVEEPRVEKSSRPEFERPALDAIKRWRFRPGMKAGQAVRTYVRLPMRFRVASG